MPHLILDMDEHDFNHLSLSSMRWRSLDGTNDWFPRADQFETTGTDREINWEYGYIYWFGDNWVHVMLARAFLQATGYGNRFQILWDMGASPDMSWVIITDYETESWRTSSALNAPGPITRDTGR